MATICNFPDIDIYLLYYFDIKSITTLIKISKSQYNLLSALPFVQELYLLNNIPKQ